MLVISFDNKDKLTIGAKLLTKRKETNRQNYNQTNRIQTENGQTGRKKESLQYVHASNDNIFSIVLFYKESAINVILKVIRETK